MRWTKTVTTGASLMLLLPALAFGHEGGHDARGTVKTIAADRIVLATAEGKEESFALGEETRFERGHTPARREDVRVGERAVVHGRREGKVLRATKVRLAPAGAPSPEK